MHTQDACQALTRCRNCGDPHRSDSHRCLARPTRSGPPTKEQLKIFRQAGDPDYQAVVRAKAAEARVSTAEEAANAVNCSQNLETANNEIPEPPADVPMCRRRTLCSYEGLTSEPFVASSQVYVNKRGKRERRARYCAFASL
ncbi:hypothetical protein K3495_g370 [Podosphaera aphanis]|nr:hypothetical protein K3495_g370 [Podosphaera aphanis]